MYHYHIFQIKRQSNEIERKIENNAIIVRKNERWHLWYKNNIVVMIKLARSEVHIPQPLFLVAKPHRETSGSKVATNSRGQSATPSFYHIYGGRKLLKKDYVPQEISWKARRRKILLPVRLRNEFEGQTFLPPKWRRSDFINPRQRGCVLIRFYFANTHSREPPLWKRENKNVRKITCKLSVSVPVFRLNRKYRKIILSRDVIFTVKDKD